MIFFIYSIVVPVVLFTFLPIFFSRYLRKTAKARWVLGVACLLFSVSWYLPSPLIYGQETQFSTHFIGGGVFTGLLWLYIKREFKWRSVWWIELWSLYCLVSALGVANELFEFTVAQAGLATITSFDTWWDLFANTSGVVVFWIIYAVYQLLHSGKKGKTSIF
ncbi:MAG: hypothetical protein Q8P11_01020 [bacterium]|nr:hypothetical protein [bacterium]